VNDKLQGMCKEAFVGSFEVMSGIIRGKKREKPHEILIWIPSVADGVRTGNLWIQVGRFIARARVFGGTVCFCTSVLLRHYCRIYCMAGY